MLGVSSLMGSINYITTIINMRAPGMTYFRLPLTIWSLFIVAILLLLALPVLTAAVAMLLFDRMGGTHFFNPAGGGEVLLWQHLFWFFGHPEVYILILPAMGIASDILSVFSRKPIFGYRAMAYSMIAIAFLSWIVWGHHMFQSGMNPALGTTFMISTMVIAVPSAIKTFNWLGTLWGGNIRFTVPMLNALAFVSMFVIGGLSGIYMASTPVDIFIHDTYFIVAHIHYVVFGGSVFGIFGAIYYWFPKMFGRMTNEPLGKLHFWLSFICFNGTFFPMHILGVGGHMRRIYNPLQYEFLKDIQYINVFITVSAIGLGLAQIPFVVNFFWSLFAGKKADINPWNANTLEWTAPSPPPHGNFDAIPTVYRGPYEYSSPLVKEDWLPQTRRLGPEAARAGAH
jgi:cytochrome c oxidase subunit 1